MFSDTFKVVDYYPITYIPNGLDIAWIICFWPKKITRSVIVKYLIYDILYSNNINVFLSQKTYACDKRDSDT